MRDLIRGGVYFALVFAAGFILGIARVLWLVPQVGERQGELLEAPVMLVVIVLAARFVVRRFPANHRLEYVYSGLVALVLLLAVEFSVVLALRGLSIAEYFAQRDAVAGMVYVILLLVFAAMPWSAGRKTANPETFYRAEK